MSKHHRPAGSHRTLTVGLVAGLAVLTMLCGLVVEQPAVRATTTHALDLVTAGAGPARLAEAGEVLPIELEGAHALTEIDAVVEPVERVDVQLAGDGSKLLKRLAKILQKQEAKLANAQESLAGAQQELADAEAELAAALALPDGKDKDKAIAKANKKINKATKKVAKFTGKVATYIANIERITLLILEIDPDFFDPDPGEIAAPVLAVEGDGVETLLYTWTPVDGASGYTLYLDVESGVLPETGYPFETSATSMLFQDLPAGLTVFGVVTATVDGLESAPSGEVSASTASVPIAPASLNAVAGSSSVVLSWPAVPGATGYRVFWDDAPGVSDDANVIDIAASPYTHSGLQPGATYFYAVAAVNQAGVGALSPETSATIASSGPQGNEGSPLGVNLHAITYWSPEWVFKDVFKQSKPWYPQEANTSAWDTGHDLTLTADGYPILGMNPNGNPEAAGTLMLRDLDGHYPGGEYICLYDGEGDIEFGMDAVEVSSSPGRIVVRVDNPSDGGIFLKITSTPNPSNPVRNIRLFQSQWEGSYQSEPFHPAFLERLAPFGMIRFMDWQRTNHNTFLKDWSDRATPSFQTQGSPERGVALEHMIDLSNTLGADPWFCMPHLATDDFVEQFAIMCRDRLDPDLKVYIEHSNEVWNGAFVQAQYAKDVGLALNLADNDFQAQLRYHSVRSVEIFEIFEDVFGGTERLVRVLGSQSDNPWVGTTVMDWQDAYQHADALTVAPYWDGDLSGNLGVINMSMSQIMDVLSGDIEDTKAITQQNFANAQARGLDLIAYEGGQHLTPKPQYVDNQAMADKLIEINRHPGMYDLYMQDLGNWAEVGGGMYAIFSSMSIYSKWGSWGIMEYEDQDKAAAPKYQACVQFVADQTADDD